MPLSSPTSETHVSDLVPGAPSSAGVRLGGRRRRPLGLQVTAAGAGALLLAGLAVGTMMAALPARPEFTGRVAAATWIRSKGKQPDVFLLKVRIERKDGRPFRKGGPEVRVWNPQTGQVPAAQFRAWQRLPNDANCRTTFFIMAIPDSTKSRLAGQALRAAMHENPKQPWWRQVLGKAPGFVYPVDGGAVVIPPAPPRRARPTLDAILSANPRYSGKP
jgi:hypothetical protein